MQIRPLEPAHAEEAGYDVPWISPSGGDVHRVGLWEGGALVGAVGLTPVRRVRRAHTGDLQLQAQTPEHASALLEEATAFADAWTPLDRLALSLPADHPAVSVVTRHGFELEVRRVDHLAPGREELSFGRLRPGFSPRPPGPPPAWPVRHHRAPGSVSFRPVAQEDSAAIRDLSIEETAVWGTLQTPWSNERYYEDRFRGTSPEHAVVALIADGELAGNGGIHPAGPEGVYALGMALSPAWQGCGLGGRLLDHLLALAWERSARRVELGVWEDNSRARALYASRGFVPEGTLRCDGIRAGGHASSLEMAVLRP